MNRDEIGDRDAIDLLARELPELDVDPATAAAIRARAHAELARVGPRRALVARMRGAGRRVYRRVELPLAGALAVAYLAWAVQTVLMVH